MFFLIKALQSQNSCNFMCSKLTKIEVIGGKWGNKLKYDHHEPHMVYFFVLSTHVEIDVVLYE